MKKFLFVDTNGDPTEGIVDGVFETRNCAVDAAVGDLVFESDSITLGVDVADSNVDERTVIGIIIEKPTTSTATVCTSGRIEGLSGLTKAQRIYLSGTGKFSVEQMTYGYIHVLGHAVEENIIDFNPANTKIKQPIMSAPPQSDFVIDQNPVEWDLSSVVADGDISFKTHEFGA